MTDSNAAFSSTTTSVGGAPINFVTGLKGNTSTASTPITVAAIDASPKSTTVGYFIYLEATNLTYSTGGAPPTP